MKRSSRNKALLFRAVLVLLGLVVVAQAAGALLAGEPDYQNYFRQPVPAAVVLVVGLVLIVGAVLPWSKLGASVGGKRSSRSRLRALRRFAAPSVPGRNDPCHCGSGLKYKKCCLRGDDERRRAGGMGRRSAALNRSNAVSSAANMASRGFRGR